jgi:hypothetical protein
MHLSIIPVILATDELVAPSAALCLVILALAAVFRRTA